MTSAEAYRRSPAPRDIIAAAAPARDPAWEETRHAASPRSAVADATDIVIVGSGLAGTLVAILAGRAGHRVTVIDLHAACPPEFRVEKLSAAHLPALERLGVAPPLVRASTRVDEVLNAMRGRVFERQREPHYSIAYREIVEVLRAEIPAGVRTVVGRVSEIAPGAERSRVTLSDGEVIEARLVVLASGLAESLAGSIGIARRGLVDRSTIVFGFDLVPKRGGRFATDGLTYYGERAQDGVDYLALLRMGDVLRGNLFAFADHRAEWVRAFRSEPVATLTRLLPGLAAVLGPFEVVGRPSMFVMKVTGVHNHILPGIVLVGDAFQTSCPAAGTGVTRLLSDVERLCGTYLPAWLGTPGMGIGKVAQFYADAAKREVDAEAVRIARIRRGFALQPSVGWRLRRQASFLRRRLRGLADPGRRPAAPFPVAVA